VVAHQHDRCAVAEDLDVAGHDGIGDEGQCIQAGEDGLRVIQADAHAVEPRGDGEAVAGEGVEDRMRQNVRVEAPKDAEGGLADGR
jgi:hypothetical protein